MARRSWTRPEELRLVERAKTMTLDELAAVHKRTRAAVRAKCGVLGVTAAHSRAGARAWTNAEIEQLLGPDPIQEIAERLGRSHEACVAMLRRTRAEVRRARRAALGIAGRCSRSR